MPTAVLLGDSIFDNAAYVGGAPDVVRQLAPKLPPGWKAELLAVDGAVMAGVPGQLRRLPGDAGLLVVSAGGNDALGYSGILGQPATSMAEAVGRLAEIRTRFRRDYAAMLDAVTATGVPTAVCTIYDARYPDEPRRTLVPAALSLLNDGITREAFRRNLPLVDLRLICDRDEDYANPIEPSAIGGEKISTAIAALAASLGALPKGRSAVFAR
ncbi:MAG TPA: SGNH/GDSL hydrolase family protein [Azospirillaceae bacterium]|nr:SGNH/GDSL hydrolase family protein [Azospirillaceae bacterium]